MKRLVFDARMASHPGIGRYQRCLLHALGENRIPWKVALVGEPKALARYADAFGWEVRPCDIKIYSWKERCLLDRFFRDADLAHFPHFNAPGRLPRRFVWTLHDLIYLNFKEYHPFPGAGWLVARQIRRLADACAGMIAVSAATREAFERRFGKYPDKIRVIHEAADAPAEAVTGAPFGLKPGFILFVGSIRAHKDVQTLVAAYEKLAAGGTAPGLVLAGSLDPRFEKRFGLRRWLARLPDARWVGGVTDAELAGLYRDAACLVLPSREEGFGLPVLEAMRAGLPVIVSDAPALTEVAGDAALVFPTGRAAVLAGLLGRIVCESDLRSRLVLAGKARIQSFDWQKAARQTADLYTRLL